MWLLDLLEPMEPISVQVFSMEACSYDGKWISDGMEVQLKSSCVSMITTLLHKGHQAENFGKGTELKPPDFYGN